MHYFLQAGRGQLELLNRARPISEVLKDERTPPRIRELLAEIPRIKSFGETEGLKPTKNYTDYVHLDRPAAVWVVSASAPLEFKSKEWKFPIVGTFPYLGWFDRKDADEYAAQLRSEGWDADVRGASAYSTLGWFRDAVLSTMISSGDEALGDLVDVVIHESVHATFYINGQSYFDESIAEFVASRLTPVYLDQTRGAASEAGKKFILAEKSGEDRRRVLHDGYENLARLYASAKSDEEKRAEKSRILTELRTRLEIKREINNATMIQFKTYNTGDEDFAALFSACGSDWGRFWQAIKGLDAKSFPVNQDEGFGKIIRGLACPG